MRISHLNSSTYVDGPGQRAAVFVKGCSLACLGCQNRHLWPHSGGQMMKAEEVAYELLRMNDKAITISGGEPFQQADALAELVTTLRRISPSVHIMIYSGYTFEELIDLLPSHLFAAIFSRIDVLVDGRFVKELDSSMMQYRGSANQRPINVRATMEAGAVVTLDWDTPEIVITGNGDLLMPIGMKDFDNLGGAVNTRRCGQTR